ncbi:MAG: outer membrane protein assembly factor BamA, partial [Gammaproteobacteria bacterium]|nr:outer membrane protein assembly factor BamA [Gammaproteobacteria bacterium]
SLYKSGFFKDVRLERDGNVLVIFVAERPAISNIEFEGNSDITKEQLESSLKQLGLAKGRVLDRSLLDKVEQELKRQYYGLGKYGVKITSEARQLERNRIDVKIMIAEGEPAEIAEIYFTGNNVFSVKELKLQMALAEVGFWGGRNKYSKQLLGSDLEAVKSFYLDRGYINFKIESSQVSLTPDKEGVYITINLTEGERYIVRDTKLVGDLIVAESELLPLISLKEGDIFSRKESLDTSERITDRLGQEGYAFANVNIIPDVDEDSKTVSLKIFVDPGRKIYVRRINVSGNTKTRDQVIRREIRQMEADWMSTKQVSQSRTRLDKLGFFEEVNVETPTVAGSGDQVDVNFNVSERPTGNLTAGIGYSDTQGALINFSVTQENFVGTGNRVSLALDRSKVNTKASLDYTNPYYTADGISRGFGVYYQEIDTSSTTITNYLTEKRGVSVSYGIPLNENDRTVFQLGYDNTKLYVVDGVTSQEILDFVNKNGNVYDEYNITTSWIHDARNRRILPTRGDYTRATIDGSVPGSDIEYYKLNFGHTQYYPFGDSVTLMLKGELGYGDGYGNLDDLPPFNHYFAGGSSSVRGYDASSLGPRDPATNSPIGGNKKVVANAELILPNPLADKAGSTRISVFFDIGNVFSSGQNVEFSQLRQSAGLAFLWLAPVGAMRFSYAIPLNEEEGDSLQKFQFTLGTPF